MGVRIPETRSWTMDARTRRENIIRLLRSYDKPVTGAKLAAELGVTRQVVVQDIAVLRAQGERIVATPRGYTLMSERTEPGIVKLFAVKHDREGTREELYTLVDCGLEVIDVIVDHPVYGQLTGQLSLSSRKDVDEFMKTIQQTGAGLLSSLTDGAHLHTVRGTDKSQFEAARAALARKGFLIGE